jgi:iron complex outermembrane receptor protein
VPRHINLPVLASVAAIVATQGLTAAFAAGAPAADQPQASEEMGEIIVTAQRRAESMMAVPVSMTAFTPEVVRDLQMESRGLVMVNLETAVRGTGGRR